MGKVIKALLDLLWGYNKLVQEREKFFRDEIIKAYKEEDWERAEFLTQLREDLLCGS